MITKRILISLTEASLLLALAGVFSTAQAQTCGQYGTQACPPQDLSIDKKVKHPINGDFVENLRDSDGEFYSPGSEVTYTLKVTNSGNQNFATVQVTDTLPEWMNPPKADDILDQNKVTDIKVNGQTISFLIKDGLKAGESKEVKLKAVIATDFKGETKRCMTNNSRVTANDRADDDSASLCAVTTVSGAKQLPSAGPEDYLPLLPFLAIGFMGMKLLVKREG